MKTITNKDLQVIKNGLISVLGTDRALDFYPEETAAVDAAFGVIKILEDAPNQPRFTESQQDEMSTKLLGLFQKRDFESWYRGKFESYIGSDYSIGNPRRMSTEQILEDIKKMVFPK